VTQKSAKKKSKKASAQPSVLGSLRATRPERIGGTRRATPATATEAAANPAPSKPAKATTTKRAAAKRPASRAKPPTSKAKPAKVKRAAAKAKPKAARVKPVKRVVPKPEPVTQAPPPTPDDGRRSGPPRGTEIVTTAVQAAGELAQIGVTVGGQLLRRAVRRIPRP
jgi:hypothetical protein